MPTFAKFRQEFKRCCGPNGTVTPESLAAHWLHLSQDDLEKKGEPCLDMLDQQVIALRMAQLLQDMDLKARGHVSAEEWIHTLLLLEAKGFARQLRQPLRKALVGQPKFLSEVQRLFEKADTTDSGLLDHRQICRMYDQSSWTLYPGKPGGIATVDVIKQSQPEKLAADFIQALDVDGDGCIDYVEFISFCVGRRKHKVVLHLYDLLQGVGRWWHDMFGMENIWHTGVSVYNREYFFSNDTVFDDSGQTSFGVPTKVIVAGWTLWTQEEMHAYIAHELKPAFHRDTYDVICNNCNHFSDRLCIFLTGKRLPEEVLAQTAHLMELKPIRTLRPFLNWALKNNVVNREPAHEQNVVKLALDWTGQDAELVLQPGQIVDIHPPSGCGFGVLGVVCDGAEIVDIDQRSEAGSPHGSGRRARTPLGCTLQQPIPDDPTKVWVRYFELGPARAGHAIQGQVCCEHLPRRRVSLSALDTKTGEPAYRAAMRTMAKWNPEQAVSASVGARIRGRLSQLPTEPALLSDDLAVPAAVDCGPGLNAALIHSCEESDFI